MKMPKTVKTFHPGDVCFAKVRGFPAWPARVKALAEENTAKQFRYHVVFFGTGESGLVKGDEMFSYWENKIKFNKSVKRKGFKEGMAEIEGYIAENQIEEPPGDEQDVEKDDSKNASTEETVDVVNTIAPTETVEQQATEDDDDGNHSEVDNLVIDEAPSKPQGPKAAANANKKKAAVKRRTIATANASDSDAPQNKRRASLDPVTSRSGRKIKPLKKFANDFDVEEDRVNKPVAAKQPGAYSNPNSTDYFDCRDLSGPNYDPEEDSEGMPIRDCANNDYPGRTILVKTPSGQLAKIKIDQNRPESFKTDLERLQWDEAVARNSRKLKMQIRDGSYTIETYNANIERLMMRKKRYDEEHQDRKSVKLKSVNWLKIETRLVDIDALIKSNVSLVKVDLDCCLDLLDELGSMTLDPLMLKKEPQVVETMLKLRRYVGNVDMWNLNEKELVDFKLKANQVRLKADFVYNKMKGLFIIPQSRNFLEIFAEYVKDFKERTKDLDSETIYKIIEDPTTCTLKLPTADDQSEKEALTETVNSTASLNNTEGEGAENMPPAN